MKEAGRKDGRKGRQQAGSREKRRGNIFRYSDARKKHTEEYTASLTRGSFA